MVLGNAMFSEHLKSWDKSPPHARTRTHTHTHTHTHKVQLLVTRSLYTIYMFEINISNKEINIFGWLLCVHFILSQKCVNCH